MTVGIMLSGAIDDAVNKAVQRFRDGFTEHTTDLPHHYRLTFQAQDDQDTRPEDSDEYGQADVDTYRLGDWKFVTVRAVLWCDGAEASDQTGGVELGRCEDETETPYLRDILNGLADTCARSIADAARKLWGPNLEGYDD